MDIRKSLVFSYLDRYASLVINIASSMVIARLLTPADIGVFSVTMVLLTFVASIRDMGAGGYLVQEKEITVDRVRAVWALQLGLGVLLALGVLIASIPVSIFYNEVRMRNIMMVVALNYAINPFGSLTYAWQIREMRFDSLALVRFCSTVAGALISIYFAWRGDGPISLAYGSLASTAVNALMAIHYRPAWFPWMPGLAEIRRVLAFGSQTTGAALIQNLASNAPELLLAKLQSMTATGLYSRASGLMQMFDRLVINGLGYVAISWFAKTSRENGDLAPPFLKATSYLCAVGFPFALGLVFLAHPTLRLLYGDQWDGAVDLTRLMGIALAVGLPASLVNPVLLATGGASRILRGMAITTVMMVVLSAIGAWTGFTQMGICLIIASALRAAYWLRESREVVGFTWKQLNQVLLHSTVVGIGAAIGPAAVFFYYGARPTVIVAPLAIGVITSVAGFIATIILTHHPLLEELQSIFSSMKRKFTSADAI